MAELGQRGDGDAAFIVDADVFQCVGEDSILARIMIAARGVGMRLRAVEQPAMDLSRDKNAEKMN